MRDGNGWVGGAGGERGEAREGLWAVVVADPGDGSIR